MKLVFPLAFLAVAYALPKPEVPDLENSLIDLGPLILPRHFVNNDIGLNIVEFADVPSNLGLDTPEIIPLESFPASVELDTSPKIEDLFSNDFSSVIIAETPLDTEKNILPFETIVNDRLVENLGNKIFEIIPTQIEILDGPINTPNEPLVVLDNTPMDKEIIAAINALSDKEDEVKVVNLDFIRNSLKSSQFQDTAKVAELSLPEPPKAIDSAFKIPQEEYPGILYKDPTLR